MNALTAMTLPLKDLRPELRDTRLSNAPFVTLILDLPTLDAKHLTRLRRALPDAPYLTVSVWTGYGQSVRLADANPETLIAAAQAATGTLSAKS